MLDRERSTERKPHIAESTAIPIRVIIKNRRVCLYDSSAAFLPGSPNICAIYAEIGSMYPGPIALSGLIRSSGISFTGYPEILDLARNDMERLHVVIHRELVRVRAKTQ